MISDTALSEKILPKIPTIETRARQERKTKSINVKDVILQDAKEPLVKIKGGYGYYGTLSTDKKNNYIQCAVCGQFFDNLSFHLRVHKLTVKAYKDLFKLSSTTSLMGETKRQEYIGRMTEMRLSTMTRKRKNFFKKNKSVYKNRRIGKKSLQYYNKHDKCPDQIIHKIKLLHKKLGRTPSSNDFRREYNIHPDIATTHFGSWNKAIKLAGLDPNPIGKRLGENQKYSDEYLLQVIKDFFDNNGRPPTTSDFKRGNNALPGKGVIEYHFGNLTKARELAGIPEMTYKHGMWLEVQNETVL